MNVTYHKSHSYKTPGESVSLITQQYKTGVYAIINSDPSLQFNLEPQDLAGTEKKLKRDSKAGKISDLIFGEKITVSDDSGLWEIV